MGLADYNPSRVAEHLRQEAFVLVTGCWGSSEKKHELPGRLSLEKVSHTIIIKVSFLHPVEENTARLNLNPDPHRGWGLRSCRCPSLFLAFLRYLFKQKSSFFFAVRGTQGSNSPSAVHVQDCRWCFWTSWWMTKAAVERRSNGTLFLSLFLSIYEEEKHNLHIKCQLITQRDFCHQFSGRLFMMTRFSYFISLPSPKNQICYNNDHRGCSH